MFARRKTPTAEKSLQPDELLSRMENFCAYRERCPKEVRTKLVELGAEKTVALQVYEALKADKYFDEQRFALAYAGGKFRNNNWGKVRIKLELRMRDISADIIQQALDIIEMEAYEAVILKILQKKMLQFEGDEKMREKSAASLIRSGFEPDLVFRILNKI